MKTRFANDIFARAVLALALAGTPALALAQQTGVKLNMQDTHTVKEIVLKETSGPRMPPGDYEAGNDAPASAKLQEFPASVTGRVAALKGYSFFVAGDQIVVVSTSDRKIADVIK